MSSERGLFELLGWAPFGLFEIKILSIFNFGATCHSSTQRFKTLSSALEENGEEVLCFAPNR